MTINKYSQLSVKQFTPFNSQNINCFIKGRGWLQTMAQHGNLHQGMMVELGEIPLINGKN